MNEEQESNVGKQAWQSQVLDAPPISLEFIHAQVEKLNSSWRREMGLMYIVCAAAILVSCVALFKEQLPLGMTYVFRIGVACAIAGMIAITVQSRRRGTQVARQETVVRSLDAYRGELERRRDYYLRFPYSSWPAFPALLIFFLGGVAFDQRPHKLQRYGFMVLFVAAATLINLADHRRRARILQQEIDALGTLKWPNK